MEEVLREDGSGRRFLRELDRERRAKRLEEGGKT